MNVFKNILFTVFLFSTMIVRAQDEVVIPFTRNASNVMETHIEINGKPCRFIFDTGASIVSFGSTLFQELVNNGIIKSDDIIKRTETIMANGDMAKAMIINIKNLKIGTLNLTNIEAMVIEGNNVPPLMGQSVLENFGSITIDNRRKQIILKKIEPLGNMVKLDKLKLIAGNNQAFSTIDNLRTQTFNQQINELIIDQILVDNNIPPQRALDRLPNKITIRYFDKKDMNKVTLLHSLIAHLYDNSTISIEDMTPYFSQAIPNYIELWIQ